MNLIQQLSRIQLSRSEITENSYKLISVLLDDVSRLKEQLKSQRVGCGQQLLQYKKTIDKMAINYIYKFVIYDKLR